MSVNPTRIYDRPAPEVIAALRAVGTSPAPQTQEQRRALTTAAAASARTIVEVTGGRVTLGWDADADGVWAGDEMAAMRATRPAQARLTRALAACVRACWPDRDQALYPGVPASRADILDAIISLGAIGGHEESTGKGGVIHAKGAMNTLQRAGLVEQHLDGSITLGPGIATWSERDQGTLRANWHRLPTPTGQPVALPAGTDDDEDEDAEL